MKNSKRNRLPLDLERFVHGRILWRVVPCLVLFEILIVCLALWGPFIIPIDNAAARWICYVLISSLPFLLFGVPHKLIDRTFCGKVVRVEVLTTVDSSSAVKPVHIYRKNTVILYVLEPDGRRTRKKAYEGCRPSDAYREGDRVFHLYGSTAVVRLPNAADATVQCAACGEENVKQLFRCRKCGRTLVKR